MKKAILTTLLIGFALAAFYYSLFWGWASGAGNPPNAKELKTSSNLALAASFVSILLVASIWILPKIKRKKQK